MQPPTVLTADKSPQGLGLEQASNSGNGVAPSTLMQMPSKQNADPKSVELQPVETIPEDSMEDMILPDAAVPVTASTADIGSARKAAKVSADNSPGGMFPKSGSPAGFNRPVKIESRPGTGRGGKKCGGTTTATISPALGPKISPSISPLVPGMFSFLKLATCS
jgi:hypothetical protein